MPHSGDSEGFDEQIEAAVAAWKNKARAVDAGQPRDRDPMVALREAVNALEAELTEIEAGLEQETVRARSFEASAMTAIQAGDHTAARDALRAQETFVETMQLLEAEMIVLCAMLDECRAVLTEHPDQ